MTQGRQAWVAGFVAVVTGPAWWLLVAALSAAGTLGPARGAEASWGATCPPRPHHWGKPGYHERHCPPERPSCPLSQGYWKTHPHAWPVRSLVLGDPANPEHTYAKSALLLLLYEPVHGDASLILAHQLIAAKLNVANGSNPAPVAAALADADALLGTYHGRLPHRVKPSSTTGRAMVAAAGILDRYNTGQLPDSCGQANVPPVANAGPDQTRFVGDTAQLDGSASTDADGDLLAFQWSFVSRPAGSAATLSEPSAVRPTFQVDSPGTYVVQLVVSDGTSDSLPDTVRIDTANSRPRADAGPDQTVPVGTLVELDGSGSSDVDGDPLTFRWSLVARPIGSQATLTDPASSRPAFTADLPGTYVAELVVSDGALDSVADTVEIDTVNSRPVADAGPDQTAVAGDTVRLDGRASVDADGDALSFRWSFTTRPDGSAAAFDDPTLAQPSFVPDLPGDYVPQLIVNDGALDSEPDTALITVTPASQPPVANAGPDQTVARGATVQLDGSASSDPEGSPLSFAWTLVSRPTGSTAALAGAATASPTFVADVNGTYVAQLIVNDGGTDSASDTVSITVQDGADLRVFFEIPPAANPPVGSQVTPNFRLDNLGPAAVTGVTVRIAIPAGYTLQGTFIPGGGSYDPATGVWTVASAPVSSGFQLALALRVNPTGPYDLTATITGSSLPDPNPANNTATALVTPDPNADLRIAFFAPPTGTHTVGSSVTISVDLTNDGPAETTGVTARLRLPAGYTFTNIGPGTFGTYDAGTGDWVLAGPLPAGVRAGLVVGARVNATGPLDLTASITGSRQPDPNLANNSATAPSINRPPVANAGPDQAVATGATVTLDGSQSSDADGGPLAFAWVFTQRAANSTATLSGADTPSPSFVADERGTYLVQLTVRDPSGAVSPPDSVAVVATVQNRPPVIRSAAVTLGAVGAAYQYAVQATDPDPGDVLIFSLPAAPAGMTIDPATGLIQWTPADGQAGPQGVTVRVQDQGGLFATQDFAVQVSSASNRAPVAVDDAYEVRTGESLGVRAPGVVANDSDADGAALTATLLAPPANGTLLFNPDGSFTYTPHTLTEGNLVRLSNVNLATAIPGVTASATSGTAANGIDDVIGTDWQSASDLQPAFNILFPQDVTVTRLELYGLRNSPTQLISAGIFQLFDAAGAELFTTGNIDIPPPNRDVTVHVPTVGGVRRVLFTPTARADGLGVFNGVGFSELKVFGSALVPRPPAVAEPNLGLLLPTQVNASSAFGGNFAEMVIDDVPDSNWFASTFNAGEFIELVFPLDVTVSRIEADTPFLSPGGTQTSLRIQCRGTFALLDAGGSVLFDSGVVDAPFQTVTREPFLLDVGSVAGVRRVRYTVAACVAFDIEPGFSELKVFGTAPVTRPPFRLTRKFNVLAGREIHSTPLVANLTDDNGDGLIDRRDIPDIVVLMETATNQLTGEIKVLSGDDGRELATLGGPDLISPWSEAAVGDLDGDGVPDVVAVHSGGNHLIAFDLGSGGVMSGNLAQLLLPLTFNASPNTNNAFPPGGAVDGSLTTSWATSVTPAPGVPFFEIGFPVEATVTELQLVGDRAVDRGDFLTGIFQLFAGDGTVLFDSGDVTLPAPDHDIALPVPTVAGVRRVRFTATTREPGGLPAGIAELRVIGSAALPTGLPRTKWISDANPMPRFAIGESTVITGAVAIANLDAAGPPEIIVGASVFDSNGRVLGDGRTLGGTTGGTGLRSAISAVADLDLDGVPELVAGPTAYRLVNGALSIVWRREDRPDGYVAIGNFDSDPEPEIVVVACPPDQFSRGVCAGQGVVYMLNHDGTDAEVWSPPTHAPVPIPGRGQGGAPTIADVDGDGVPEIGVAGAVYFTMFNRDGTVRWRSAISDRSSSSTGSTVFDFDGDGSVEVAYRDEQFLRVYRGSDGVLLAKVPIASSTWSEMPVVADVDNDGRADLVVVGDPFIGNTGLTGVHVFQDVANQWTRTRRIWNQHSYHVTNVDEDGRIPLVETPHWLVPGLNNFRLNAFVPGESGDAADSFTYQLFDGALLSNVATVRLAIRPRNAAPRFVSTPVTTAATGVRYTYAAQATDPDAGDILTFSLPTAPAGMTIDPLSGLVQWTPAAGQLGSHDVVVRVQDARGLFALQGYSIQVASPVTVPDVVGQPQASASAAITGAGLTVGAVGSRHSATTPAGAVFSQSPAGGTLVAPGSAVGLVVSLGPPPVGTVPDVVGQSQPGAQADISAAGFVLGAVGGQHSALVAAGIVVAQDPAAGTVAPTGAAVSLVVSLGLPPGDIDADGDGVTGNQGDCDDTNPDIRPGAVDLAGDGIDQNCNGRDSVAGDDTPPTVAIESPAEDAVVTQPTDIVGTATDANFLRYTLELAGVDETVFRVIGSGTTPVVSGTLGRLDPTLLENGMYRVRLTAEDANGSVASAERVYQVSGHAKAGLLALSFVDVHVPLSGIPLTVIRSYDSRVKTQRDFGVGWTLQIKAGSYQDNRPPGEGWTVTTASGPLGAPCAVVTELRSHLTEIRLSDREFYLFRPRLTGLAAVVGGCVGSVTYDFVDGTLPGASLGVIGNRDIIYTSGDVVTEFDGSADTGAVFNPTRVRLTTIDGRVIDLARGAGVTRLQDSNGHALTITPGGIAHTSGTAIAFQRDPAGRITRMTDPRGFSLSYGYDARGDLVEVRDQAGQQTTFVYGGGHNLLEVRGLGGARALGAEYDADGRLIATVDALGRRTEWTHDISGRQDILVDARGNVSRIFYDEHGNTLAQERTVTIDGVAVLARQAYAYDARGNAIVSIDADNRRQDFTYDLLGNETQGVADPDGLRITRRAAYTAAGDPLSQTDPNGDTIAFGYDTRGNPSGWVDVDGGVTSAVSDAAGRITRVQDRAGRVTLVDYDDAGRVRRRVDSLGHTIEYTYDAAGNRLTQTAQRTVGGVPRALTTRFEYDALNRLVRVIDPLGQATRYEYNVLGRLSQRSDPLGRVTRFQYNAVGDLVLTEYHDGTTERRTYDASGNLVELVDREGRATRHQYDELGRRVSTELPNGGIGRVIYTPGGRIAARIAPDGARTDYEYDAVGRLIVIRQPLVSDAPSGTTVRPEWRFEYDTGGRTTAAVDPRGVRTELAYDSMTRSVTVTLPDGTSVVEQRDEWGRVVRRRDQEGRSVVYDYLADTGRLAAVTLPPAADGQPIPIWRFAYDEGGHLVAQTDPLGRTTRFDYDEVGRLIRATLPSGRARSFGYDAAGRLTMLRDYDGAATAFEYDAADRLVRRTLPDGSVTTFAYTPGGRRQSAQGPHGATAYDYDAAGRLIRVSQPGAGDVQYAYDLLDRVIRIAMPAGAVTYEYDGLGRLVNAGLASGNMTYGYDVAGRLTRVTAPNGVTGAFGHDQRNRLSSLTYEREGQTLASFAYTYTPVGRRASVVEPGATTSYQYDGAGRLLAESRVGMSPYSRQYTYDLAGNRTRLVADGVETLQAYDVDDRLLSSGAMSFTHDDRGNLVRREGPGTVVDYTWTPDNRLASVTRGGVSVAYTYDADGRRVTRQSPQGLVRYLLDDRNPSGLEQVVEERDDAGILLRRYDHGLAPIAREQAGELLFHQADGQGNVRLLTDGAGTVAATYAYDAFGTAVAETGTTGNDHLYGGQQLDRETGLYYLRKRHYDAGTGRFLSRDPHDGDPSLPTSLHRYTYAGNDPANFADPTGEFFSLIDLSLASIISGGVRGLQVGKQLTTFCRVKGLAKVIPLAISLRNAAGQSKVATTLLDRLGPSFNAGSLVGYATGLAGGRSDQTLPSAGLAVKIWGFEHPLAAALSELPRRASEPLRGQLKKAELSLSVQSSLEASLQLSAEEYLEPPVDLSVAVELPSFAFKGFSAGTRIEREFLDIRVCGFVSVGTVSGFIAASIQANGLDNTSFNGEIGVKLAVPFLPEAGFSILKLPDDLK